MSLLHSADVHRCNPPTRGLWTAVEEHRSWREADVGSLWQCDECGAYHEARREPPFTRWEKISPRRARRLLRKITAAKDGTP